MHPAGAAVKDEQTRRAFLSIGRPIERNIGGSGSSLLARPRDGLRHQRAVKSVFARYGDAEAHDTITEQFRGNLTFPAGDDLPAEEFVANMKAVKGLPQSATQLAKEMKLDGGDVATLASVGEFLLEGLYVNNRLSKYNSRGKTYFKR